MPIGLEKPIRERTVVMFKSLTDINECLLDTLRMYFTADSAWKYNRRAESSNLVIEGPGGLNHARTAEKYPQVIVRTTRGNFQKGLIGDKIAQDRPTSIAVKQCNMEGTSTIAVKSYLEIEADQLATRIAFFLYAYKDIIRSEFGIDIRNISYTDPQPTESKSGKNLYSVAISLIFMVSCNWVDKLNAETLRSIVTRYKLKDRPDWVYEIRSEKEPEEPGEDDTNI